MLTSRKVKIKDKFDFIVCFIPELFRLIELICFLLCFIGCEVTSEILVATSKYNIKLLIPSPEGLTELWLKADTVSLTGQF